MAKHKKIKPRQSPQNKKERNMPVMPAPTGHGQESSIQKTDSPWRFFALIVLTAGILLYANTAFHNYTLDDDPAISKNKLTTQGFSGIPKMFSTAYWYGFIASDAMAYRPLSLVMFATEWQFFPGNPHAHHIVNILLYGLTGFVLFFTLRKLFDHYTPFFALTASLLFIAHPIHTEVVASIKSRDEILCFLFMTTSAWLLLIWLTSQKPLHLVCAAACSFLALLSKENAVTFAGIVVAILVFKKISLKKSVLIALLFAAIALCYVLIRSKILGGFGTQRTYTAVDNVLSAAPDFSSQMATAFFILGKYIQLLVFPHPLSYDYSFNQIPVTRFSNIFSLISLAGYVAAGIYAAVNILKKDAIAFGIVFYFVTFSVVSNLFLKIGSTLGERFMYAPSLGFCIAITMLLFRVFRIDHRSSGSIHDMKLLLKKSPFFAALTGIILLLYSFKTVTRNRIWESNLTLFSTDAQSSPNSARTHHNHGSVLMLDKAMAEKDPQKQRAILLSAIPEFKKAVAIFPEYADAYINMGITYTYLKDTTNALAAYEKAIKYNTTNAHVRNLAGYLYGLRRDYDKAIRYLTEAVQLNPGFDEAYYNLGFIYGKINQPGKAIPYLQKATELRPSYAEAYNLLGNAYGGVQQTDKAVEAYKKAIQINPKFGEVYTNLGVTYGISKNYKPALEAFSKAIELDPKNARAWHFMGITWQFSGDTAKANFCFNKSNQLLRQVGKIK